MSNDEYILMLEEQNMQKRQQELHNKEFQEQQKLQEREQGFNTYMQGANKNLPQVQQPVMSRRNASNQQRGARRQWRDPSKSQERSLEGRPQMNTLGQKNKLQEDQKNNEQQPRYFNPFDLSAKQGYGADQTNPTALANAFGAQSFSNIAKDNSPTDNIGQIKVQNQPRKKWGVRAQDTQQRQQIEMDDINGEFEQTQAQADRVAILKGQTQADPEDNDEDDYSDDDFEQNAETTQEKTALVKPLKVIMEQTGESRIEDGNSTINDQYINDSVIEDSLTKNDIGLEDSNTHLEMFIRTATAKEMDIIRESISNFNDITKNFSNIKSKRKDEDNDEYIEDEFEEDIPEVDDNNGSSSSEEHKFEVIRKESITQSKRSNARTSRPVSAVYNLSQFKTGQGVSSGMQSQRTLHHGGHSASMLPANTSYQPSTVKKELSSKQKTIQSAWNPSGVSSIQHLAPDKQMGGGQSYSGTGIQPNKVSISSKPFTRPFSEANPGKRKGPKVDLQKHFLQTDMIGQNKQSFDNMQQAKYDTGNLLSVRDADNIEASYGGQSAATHLSQKDTEMQYLIQAISQLDDSQRQHMVQVLQNKGSAQSQYPGFQATGQSIGFGQSLAVPGMATGKPQKSKFPEMLNSANRDYGNMKQSVSSMQVETSSQNQPRSRNELKIKVLSTHGDPYFCGLTEIELFDNAAKKIVVMPANVVVNNIGRHGGGTSSIKMSTKSLVNGVKFTNEHRNMWIGSLPAPQSPPMFLEIVVFFAINVELSAVKIWNYNKSMRDATKGVREIEVFLNNELKHEGTVCMGKGSTKEDYSQLITIGSKVVQVPKETIAVIEEVNPKNEETIEYSTENVDISFNQLGNKNALKPSPEPPKILVQQVSDYRTDYVDKNKPIASQSYSTEGNTASKVLSNKQQVRNIDVIRQRQEISRSRSRSPINQLGQQKPLWLQDKGMNSNSASQRSLLDGVGQKLNKRQAEQKQRENEKQKDPISQEFYASVSKDALLGNQVPQTIQEKSNSKLDNIFMKEDESVQNMEWQPIKVANKFDIAKEIQSASQQVQNAVDSVNKAVSQNEKNLETPDKAPFAFKTNVKSNQGQNNIEESLDSLDFFKVTNLGRINNEFGQQSQRKVDGKKDGGVSENKRGQWGDKKVANSNAIKDIPSKSKVSETIISEISENSNQTGSKDSITRSAYKAPRIKKNPFPDDFCMPSPARSSQKSASRSSIKRERINESKQITDQQAKQIEEENNLLDEIDVMYPSVHEKVATKKAAQNIVQKETIDILEEELEQIETQDNKGAPIPNNIHSQKSKVDVYQDKMKKFQKPFIIPELPMGKVLEFNVLDTWGDINYLGLTGIEIFDKDGNQVKIDGATSISANPSDINLLMGQGTDPRTVDKLVDGNYFTNDDFNAWLTPFTHGEDHTITIKLPQNVEISMIRIWNYNKSRIHSFRGARLMTCELDGDMIFKGEISKAPGNTQDPEACCEIILFTEDESILCAIDRNDWLNEVQLEDSNETEDGENMTTHNEQQRPMTATKKFGQEDVQELQNAFKNQNKPTSMFDERPKTKAIRREPNAPFIGNDEFDEEDNKPNNDLEDFQPKVKKEQPKPKKKSKGVKGRIIELNITESWGDLFYVGLNGLDVMDENEQRIRVDVKNVEANPRDMNSIPGHGQDHRTLDKLINNVNNTCDDRNMWLIPFNSGEDHTIKIDLGKMTQISGLRFYNYNKSSEDSLRGVKQIVISVDGKLMTAKQGVTLRKAPGFILPEDEDMRTDIGQTVNLPFSDGWKTNMIMPLQKQPVDFSRQTGLMQEYETICMPIGFTFRFNLYSTHGDNYYVGLNGIELYDQLGNIIQIDPQNEVMANPAGINKLQGMDNDVRSLEKLFNGQNQMFDDRNMWLAPFKFTRSHAAANSSEHSEQREPNFIAIVFDQPKAISAVRIWNYSKTASRGIHEFELVVDDKPIFRGFAKKAPDSQQEWEKQFQKDFSTVVLFSSEQRIVDRFRNQIVYDPSKQQDVLMFNERKQVNAGKVRQRPNEKFVFNEKDRPTTKYGGGFL